MKLKDKKRISIKKTAIIAGIVLFSLFLPNIVHAFSLAQSIWRALMRGIANFVLSIASFSVKLAAGFFETMLDIGFKKQQHIAEVGWEVARDFSNLFFILFMVIIAFATILRLEKYGWRQLLPKIIIIALLINFSLVICYVIIDFSNISANFFIQNAKEGVPVDKDGKKSISAALSDSLNLTKVLLPRDCDDYDEEKKECKEIFKDDNEKIKECEEQKETDKKLCEEMEDKFQKAASEEETFINMIISAFLGSIVLVIAAFTLFAGGILLVIRLLFLWFLVMLVPFAFLSYIMPGLRKIWQNWWKTFIKWALFAPGYAFFIWLAVKISVERRVDQMTHLYKQISQAGNPQTIDKFFTASDNILSFLFIIGLLLGGLIAAQKLSFYGADRAVKLGQKWGQGAARRITRYPREIAGVLGAGTLQTTGKTFQRIPGLKKFGRGLETKGTMLMRKPEESIDAKRYKAVAENMSEENLIKDLKSRSGVYGLIATKVAMGKGFLQKTKDREAVQAGVNTLRGYGMTEEADELEQRRFSILKGKDDDETKEKMTEAHKKSKVEGYHKEYKPNMFRDEEGETAGQKAADIVVQSETTVGDARDTIKAMPENTQKEILKTNKKNFTEDFNNAENIRRRSVDAAIIGRTDLAFADRSGSVNKPALEIFVKNMDPVNYRDLDPKSIESIAPYVNASTATGAERYLTPEKKEAFVKNWEKLGKQDVLDGLKNKPAWKSHFVPPGVVDLKEPPFTT